MTREERIARHFDRAMSLIEIGPSHSPIVPKRDGWRTTVVDHAPQGELVAKYAALGIAVDRIEPVDFVWRGGPLTKLIPSALHGTFDGLLASHVGEHLPDLLTFLQDASRLLKPNGVLALALPDKRVCFDFFQPMTATGDVVAAFLDKRTRHLRRSFFNQAAYFVTRDGQGGWTHGEASAGFQLANPLSQAKLAIEQADENPESEYRDTHAWTFTPKSFELLILELNLLGYTDWAIRSVEAAPGVEFYAWLEKARISMPESAINPLRLSLLAAMVRETQDPIDQMAGIGGDDPSGVAGRTAPKPSPSGTYAGRPQTIVAVIALYNGAKYIEAALRSVLGQTFPPTEIIVVDDGSTDDGAGAEIVRQFARTEPITLLTKPNGGQSSARNFGVRHSAGDLIAFLDQDDAWYEDHLAELAQPFRTARTPALGWVYSNLDEVDEDGLFVCRSLLDTMETVHPKRNVRDCLRQDMYILPSASLISRAAFDAVGGFDERLCGYEDDDLFLRMFRAGYENIYLERPLSQWRIHTTSTSFSQRFVDSRNIYVRKLLETFPDDPARHRYFARDVIAPRFFPLAVNEYRSAAARGDSARMDAAWMEIMFLARQMETFPEQLLGLALGRFKSALSGGDSVAIDAAWRQAAEVVDQMPRHRTRLRMTLNALRNPAVSRPIFALRHLARPIMLWAFRAT